MVLHNDRIAVLQLPARDFQTAFMLFRNDGATFRPHGKTAVRRIGWQFGQFGGPQFFRQRGYFRRPRKIFNAIGTRGLNLYEFVVRLQPLPQPPANIFGTNPPQSRFGGFRLLRRSADGFTGKNSLGNGLHGLLKSVRQAGFPLRPRRLVPYGRRAGFKFKRRNRFSQNSFA